MPITLHTTFVNATFAVLISQTLVEANHSKADGENLPNLLNHIIITPSIALTPNRITFAREDEITIAEALDKTGRIPSIDPLKNPEEAQLPQAGETRHTNTRSRHPDATRIAVYGNPPKAEPRQTIALERPPGSGKTTTASLTARSFKVTEGTITPGSIDILHIRKTIPPSSSQPAVSRKPAVCRTSA